MADFVIKGDVDLDAKAAAEGIIELTTDIKKANKEIEGMNTQSANLGKALGKFLPMNVRKGISALKELSKGMNVESAVTSVKAFGSALVSGLSAGVKAAIQFGVALNAATGGLLLIIGAIVGLIALMVKLGNKQAQYNKNVDAARKAHEGVNSAIDRGNTALTRQETAMKASTKAAQVLPTILKNIHDWIANKIQPVVDTLTKAWEFLSGLFVKAATALGLVTEKQLEENALAQEHVEEYAAINDATAEYNKTLDKIVLTQKDSKKIDEEKLSALNSYIDALAEQSVLMGGQDKNLNRQLEKLVAQRDALMKNLETVKELTDLSAQIEAQETARLKTINQQDDATQSIAEKYAQQAAEEQRAYDLEVARVKAMENVSEEQRAQLLAAMAATKVEQDRLRAIRMGEEERAKADKEAAALEAEQKKYLDDRKVAQKEINQLTIAQLQAEGKERQALALQRKEVLNQIDAREDLTAAEKEDMKTIQKTTWALKDKKKIADQMKDVVSASTDAAVSIASSAASIVGGILDAEIEKTNARLDAEIKTIDDTLKTETEIIDKWIEEENQRLDDARQRALEEAGFAVATTEEGLEAAMQAAIESGDEMAIYREEQRQKELKINQKYDKLEKEAQKKADDDKKAQQAKADAEKAKAEKEAAEKSADLQYKQAMMTWTISVAEGGVDFAKAISKAIAAGAPFASVVLASLQAAISGAALTAIIAAMPKKPAMAFAHGTIVDRPTQFKFASGSELRDGIMGEAGPEAIVPLERMDNGDLGVQASGGGQLIAVLDLFNLFVKAYNGRSLDARLEGMQ